MYVHYVVRLLDALYLGRQTFRSSSMTPQLGRQFNFFKIHHSSTLSVNNQITPVVIMYNCRQCYVNNYVQMLTTCVFSSIVPSFVTQGQGVAMRYYNCQNYVGISRDDDWQHQAPSTKHQGIDGYFCDNVFLYCYCNSHNHELPSNPIRRMDIFASNIIYS